MGRVSVKKDKTVYQLAREELGLSRADATEYIPGNPDFPGMRGISASMLAKMESGASAIQPSDVVAMAERYNKPELRNYYCCHECEIGRIDAPEVPLNTGVHEMLVNMAVALKSLDSKQTRLMEILVDGKLSEDEQADFDVIYDELEQVSRMVESLQLWCEKMKIEASKK